MKRAMHNRKKFLSAIIIFLVVAGAMIACYLVMEKLVLAEYELQISELTAKVDQNTYTVYVANEDIKAGKEITADMLRVESHLVSQPVGLFEEGDIGRRAIIDIPKDSLMFSTYGAVRTDEGTTREVEYSCMYLSSSLESGDYIDVRIRFQNGEDFSVLSKKQIEKISLAGKSCHLDINDVELQSMASAIIDMNQYSAVIYCVEYTMPSVQEATPVTYPVRDEILLSLYSADSTDYRNWLSKRGALELRLNGSAEDVGGMFGNSIDISNFAGGSGKEHSNTNGMGIVSDETEDAGPSEE